MSAGTEQRKLAAIMFTDMVGYSALTQHNEALALELLEEHRSVLRALFPKHQGTEIKTTGDGFLVEFASALAAVRCAIEIQRSLATRNVASAGERQLQVRIGIHIGDVIHREGDVLGDGVNIASRIEPLAGPGGICISVDVERQIRNAIETSLVKLGPTELKNIQMPMELFRIVLPWEKQKESDSPEMARPAGAEAGRGVPLSRARATRSLAAVAVVLITLGVGWWLVHQFAGVPKQLTNPQTNSPPPIARPGDQKSIAVLPFANMNPGQAEEYLSDGMTEELLNALAKVRGLRVAARTSAFAFKGKNEDIRSIGAQLNVRYVLEGSVRKAGNKLRITAQLISVADGFHLWSETYDREMADIFEIQSDVARRVAEALKVQLGVEEQQQLAKKPTHSLAAYDLYLLGRRYWNQRSAESLKRAADYFEQAVKEDPKYALAYSGMADAYGVLANRGLMSYLETSAKAKSAVARALELDPTLAEAHASSGFTKENFDWDWNGAEREYRRALDLNPNYATAYAWYSIHLTRRGRSTEALEQMRRAVELDPLSPALNRDLAWTLLIARQFDAAIQQSEKTLKLEPNILATTGFLADAYFAKNNFPRAMATLEQVELAGATMPEAVSRKHTEFRQAYEQAGASGYWRKVLEFEQVDSRNSPSPYKLASLYARLGETKQAIKWLTVAYQKRSWALINLKIDAVFERLRGEPEFIEILKGVGLAP